MFTNCHTATVCLDNNDATAQVLVHRRLADYVLSGYDDATEWPPRSGLSYTAGLAPEAWAQGFRMGDQAEHLMDAMTVCLGESYRGPIDFPMKTVAQVSRRILLRVAGAAKWRSETTREAWLDAVSQSSHKAHMAVVSAGARNKPRAKR